MSWTDDIRCLYCDGRLPLYRKITNGQFCCTAHRKAYWKEQERLAVERLHQTHSTLKAYRPTGAADAEQLEKLLETLPDLEPDAAAVEQERPWWLPLVNRAEIPMAALVPNPRPTEPQWPHDGLAGGMLTPFACSSAIRRPLHVWRLYECGLESAGAVALAWAGPKPGELAIRINLASTDIILHPVLQMRIDLQPVFETIEVVEEQLPPFAGLLALKRPEKRECAKALASAEPLGIAIRARLPLEDAIIQAALVRAELVKAGLRALPMDQVALVHGPWIDHLGALESRGGQDVPLFTLATPPARPRLQLAAGRRYTFATPPSVAQPLPEPHGFSPHAPQISLPHRAAVAVTNQPTAVPEALKEPKPVGLLPLPCLAQASQPPVNEHPAPSSSSLPQTPRPDPLRPSLKLEPVDPRPSFDLTTAPQTPAPTPSFEPAVPLDAQQPWLNAWPRMAVDFWNHAPRDLKMLAVAIPILLGLALHPSLPKMRVTAPAQAGVVERGFRKAWNDQWMNVRQTMVQRAAVALDEDFRSGLDDWASHGDAATEWSFDATGFVRPGALALYKPSMPLTDYQMQFLGMIDKKALSWVVRAADFNNYYVVKLVVVKPGPLPRLGVTRYAVINGKADARKDTVVPIDARPDMLYRIRTEVQGGDFTLTVQGQLADSWSEPRLAHGGIGFFSARGEESRLRWVQLTHQYDMLGRLCAYLAPVNMSQSSNSGSGSWQQ